MNPENKRREFTARAALYQLLKQIAMEGPVATLSKAFARRLRHRAVYYAPREWVERWLKIRLEAIPVVNGMPDDSLMARVALEADATMKTMLHRPDLVGVIPGYQTSDEWLLNSEKEFRRIRFWIEGGHFKVEATERELRFVETPMKIGVERLEGFGATKRSFPEPELTLRSEHLSRHYDEFAREIPVLHEMRECIKVVVIADWLKKKHKLVQLPARGRRVLPLPERWPGIMHVVVAPDRIPARVTISGGAYLKAKVTTSRSVDPPRLNENWKVAPFQRDNSQLRKLMARKTEVPLPTPPGWITRSRMGQKAKSSITILRVQTEPGEDPIRTAQILDKMNHQARMLEHYDKIINTTTQERVTALRALGTIETNARREVRAMADEALQTVTAGAASLDELSRLMERHPDISQIKGLYDQATSLRNRLDEYRQLSQSWKRGEFNEAAALKLRSEIGDRVQQLAVDVARQRAKDPQFVSNVLSRSTSWARTAVGLKRLTDQTLNMVEMNQLATQLNDNLGDQAQLMKQVQSLSRRSQDRFQALRHELTHPASPRR